MLQQERHSQILAKLSLEGKVVVKELSQDFNVTEDCIRKDLTSLEKEGLLKRIDGGATQVRRNLHIINAYEGKITTYDVDDGLTKKEVIHSSKKSYMVGETAKLELDGNYVFALIEDFT